MEFVPNSVSTVFAHGLVSILFRHGVNGIANFGQTRTGSDRGNGRVQGFPCRVDEFPCLDKVGFLGRTFKLHSYRDASPIGFWATLAAIVDIVTGTTLITDDDCSTVIPVHAIEKAADIKGYHVAQFQWSGIRNSVTNDFIDTGTHRFGKSGIIQWTGIRAGLNQRVVHDGIDGIRRDAGLGDGTGHIQRSSCQTCRLSHTRRGRCVVKIKRVGMLEGRDVTRLGIGWPWNGFRNGTTG
mmetsp:Transcript_25830/g.48905  ORF Transcript_25830/g.48905 Transcript_25830/m.48905 type:complete len:239 (-) Transcript_25830:187-903(-)